MLALLLLAAVVLAPVTAQASPEDVSPEATRILKRMTDYVGNLKQFSVEAANSLEVVLVTGQKIQFDSTVRMTAQRPNQLRSDRIGELENQSFYYDGKSLTIFSPRQGFYATVPAPGTIDAMLDFARDNLDIVAPATDLMTMDAYERLTEDATSAFVVGKSVIGGVGCDHLAFRSPNVDWQVWIEDGDRPLPRKYVITTLDLPGQPQFEVQMTNWNLAPQVTPRLFEFVPPTGARRIDFLPVGNPGGKP